MLHAFLPLLASQRSSLLFLSPSIIPSLAPPLHAAENTIFGGFQQYISTLRKEVSSLGINIVQLHLGNFDNGVTVDHEEQQLALSQHLAIAEATRQRLESKGTVERTTKHTSMRELHNSIFDAINRGKGKNGTIFVGRGARTYDLAGKWIPDGLVGWMLGSKGTDIDFPASDIKYRAESPDSNIECKLFPPSKDRFGMGKHFIAHGPEYVQCI